MSFFLSWPQAGRSFSLYGVEAPEWERTNVADDLDIYYAGEFKKRLISSVMLSRP